LEGISTRVIGGFLVVLFCQISHTCACTRIYQIKGTQHMSQAKTLTDAEVAQVLNHIQLNSYAMRNRVMFLTGLWSGMRVGEIASLTVGDVIHANNTVKAEIKLAAEQTKGRHARTVFVPEKLRAEIGEYMRLRGYPHADVPVFLTHTRRAFSANLMAQHFYWLFRAAGISASSHSMRRTFITNLANKGIGVRVLASIAGHRSIAVTQRYIDVNDEIVRRAVELV